MRLWRLLSNQIPRKGGVRLRKELSRCHVSIYQNVVICIELGVHQLSLHLVSHDLDICRKEINRELLCCSYRMCMCSACEVPSAAVR